MIKFYLKMVAIVIAFTMPAYAEEAPMHVEGAKSISVSEAKKLFDAGAAFVDSREDAAWGLGRIPGAIHMDVKTDKFSKTALLGEVKTDEAVVFYCNGVKCGRSSEACKKALGWGYKKVYYFREGFPGWKKAGYPVE